MDAIRTVLTTDMVSAILKRALVAGLRDRVLVAMSATGKQYRTEAMDTQQLEALAEKAVAHEGSLEILPREAVAASG